MLAEAIERRRAPGRRRRPGGRRARGRPGPGRRTTASRLHCPVVGVTGSTGKTTTKDFLAAVLRSTLRVVVDPGQPQQRARRAADGAVARARTPTCSSSRWACAGSDRSRELCAIARPTIGARHQRRASRTSSCSARRRPSRARRASSCVRPGPDGAAFLNGDDAFSAMLAADVGGAGHLLRARRDAAPCAPRTSRSTPRAVRPSTLTADGATVRVDAPGPGPPQRLQRARGRRGRAPPRACRSSGSPRRSPRRGVSAMRMEVFTVGRRRHRHQRRLQREPVVDAGRRRHARRDGRGRPARSPFSATWPSSAR